MVPLYEVIQGSQSRRDHTPLVEKAKGIFSNRLCHMKEVRELCMQEEERLIWVSALHLSTPRQILMYHVSMTIYDS